MPVKIALIGAPPAMSALVLEEALARGHAVTALACTSEKLAPRPGLTVVKADVTDAAAVAAAVTGADAVISAYNPRLDRPGDPRQFLEGREGSTPGSPSGVKRSPGGRRRR